MTSPLIEQAAQWFRLDPDPDTRAYLGQLLTQANSEDDAIRLDAGDQLGGLFEAPLTFGTAGLRGPLGPGPARMNRLVVSQAAAGFGDWLLAQGLAGGRIIIGFDARWKSARFAQDSAEILTGKGFQVLVTAEPTPTPIVAFGIGHFDCVAGIVVTASHNPPADNGYKVYLGDGSQIVPPEDAEIEAAIRNISLESLAALPRGESYTVLDDELFAAYRSHAASLISPEEAREIVWVHTAMHGVGGAPIQGLAEAAGFPAPLIVAEQAEPDPEFPTVAFPNPEEPGAIDLALGLATESNADVVIANDPDADRCAVACPMPEGWRMLTGDELGVLLGDDAIRRGVAGTYANSVVSSTLLGKIATAAGQPHVTTLTGFKWIGRVPGLVFGYEEAIGYCCDPAAVPDKDGLSAALMILRLAAQLKAAGSSLAQRLAEIYRIHGRHATTQLSLRVTDLSIIAAAMERLRRTAPAALLGAPVEVRDLAWGTAELPPTDAIELTGERIHVVVRPSGTEPKLKCYLEVRSAPEAEEDPTAARLAADADLAELRSEMSALLTSE